MRPCKGDPELALVLPVSPVFTRGGLSHKDVTQQRTTARHYPP